MGWARTRCAINLVSFPPSFAGSSNCTLMGRLAESSLPLCSFTTAVTVPSMPSRLRLGLCFGEWKTVTFWDTRMRAPGWMSESATIRTQLRRERPVVCRHLLGLHGILLVHVKLPLACVGVLNVIVFSSAYYCRAPASSSCRVLS